MRSSDWSEGPKVSFAIIFGLVGAGISLGFWYFMLRVLNIHGIYLAVFAGAIVGIAVRLGGMGRSKLLGAIAAGYALLAIGSGYILHAQGLADEWAKEEAKKIYDEEVAEVKKLVAMTKRTEVRAYLAEEQGVDLKKISKKDVARWREEELPQLTEFLEAPATEMKASLARRIRAQVSFTELCAAAFDFFSLLLIVCGIVVAYCTAGTYGEE